MKLKTIRLVATTLLILCATLASRAAGPSSASVRSTVDRTIRPLMAKYNIPGMSVGVLVDGKPYLFHYGLASLQTRHPVTNSTLFELGSVSKTFTATLASYAETTGHLSLTDKTGKYLPSLQGTPFGSVSLLNLGTHTPGGLSLQVPDGIRNNDQLLHYLGQWRPSCAPGTCRTYTNIGIGALGLITAKSMGQDFAALMEQRLFPALGLRHSFLHVPASAMPDYAQGYTDKGAPIRVAPGVLASEAYGVKATADDVLRFLEANMRLLPLDERLQQAITRTHTGYFRAGAMTQDLIWEQYPYPVTLPTLLRGNSPAMIFNATPAAKITPPQSPRNDVWINKTGSTNGFGAYVAFIPEKRLAIVLLANRSYPIDARVTAAYQILTPLAAAERQGRR